MTHSSKTILTMAAAALIALTGVQASPSEMTGNILVSGSVALNTGYSGNATQLMGWYGGNGSGSALVQGANGNFAGYIGAAAFSGSPWNFSTPASSDPLALSASSMTDFLTVGGMTFYLRDWSVQSQILNDAFGNRDPLGALTVSGTGYVSGPGFLMTSGTWTFSTVDLDGLNKATFSFQSSGDAVDATAVPDGGRTIALLGFVVGALAVLRYKVQALQAAARS